jgi:site-specific DNA-cytosine methylase
VIQKPLRVLVACEFSGVVRDAFRALGHEAVSCDLLESEAPGQHLQNDVREVLEAIRWDLLIAHPPCTYLAVSGARWFKDRPQEQADALAFVQTLLSAPIPHSKRCGVSTAPPSCASSTQRNQRA